MSLVSGLGPEIVAYGILNGPVLLPQTLEKVGGTPPKSFPMGSAAGRGNLIFQINDFRPQDETKCGDKSWSSNEILGQDGCPIAQGPLLKMLSSPAQIPNASVYVTPIDCKRRVPCSVTVRSRSILADEEEDESAMPQLYVALLGTCEFTEHPHFFLVFASMSASNCLAFSSSVPMTFFRT